MMLKIVGTPVPLHGGRLMRQNKFCTIYWSISIGKHSVPSMETITAILWPRKKNLECWFKKSFCIFSNVECNFIGHAYCHQLTRNDMRKYCALSTNYQLYFGPKTQMNSLARLLSHSAWKKEVGSDHALWTILTDYPIIRFFKKLKMHKFMKTLFFPKKCDVSIFFIYFSELQKFQNWKLVH